jgi:hypothetical protein
MKAGIIIPFRDTYKTGERTEELQILCSRIREICELNEQEYEIYVIVQDDDQLFNKGILINAGAFLADCDYFILHDVDNIPIMDHNIYRYREFTGNIVWKRDDETFTDTDDHFGDVVFFKKEDFLRINGISNMYYGWGFEVSNTPRRLEKYGITYKRGDGIFTQMKHDTKGRFNGNPNFINNMLVYYMIEMHLMEGYHECNFTINNQTETDHIITLKIGMPPPQYELCRNLTMQEIENLTGECDEKTYNWVIETYGKKV